MEKKSNILEIDFILVNIRGIFKDLVLYSLMKLGKAHGYAIKRFLSQTIKMYVPSSGVLYPTLHELEKEGLLNSVVEGNRRVYSLTEKGWKYMESRLSDIEKNIRKINRAIEIASYVGLREMFDVIKKLWNHDIELSQETLNEIKARVQEIISILNGVLETRKSDK
ncbi:PadR family transcriptional regulator [Ignisphaera sp. 4213-co]|uniref:PadR family transcriptional regulator n=1 Tax=Ignisphaera cupida TaxID=3050454 RepID=A0ABD4Z5A3_9CREN|nr:PadR family transcriptional regulator [Ignisphaera sp. 4213-co]MDK6028182.1 PadR family transcriptional regulator [Ignisphaera sp. 4213-co]